MVAGGTAGLTSSIIACPLDVIKTKLQSQRAGSSKYRGTLDAFAVIWREEGPRGYFRGLGPTVLGYLPNWAIYFLCYDRYKHWLSNRFAHGRQTPSVHIGG